jgi:hypothetical protein
VKRLPSYYGKMTEGRPGRMVCITQHDITDSPYPYWHDSSIRMYRFDWWIESEMRQDDQAVRFARLIRREDAGQDFHVKADVRLDGITGLIFRSDDQASSCFAFLVILPDHPLYKTYFPPEQQHEVVAANYSAADRHHFGLGHAMAVLVRMQNGKLTVLRGIRLMGYSGVYEPARGSWCGMQVKARGRQIVAAVDLRNPDHYQAPFYVTYNDPAPSGDRIGLMTDQSTGAFRNVQAWDRPRMIRDLWR